MLHESTTSAQVSSRGPGNDILLLDPQSGAMLGSLKAHKETVYAITVLEEPELAIVTSGLDGFVCVWEHRIKGRRNCPLPTPRVEHVAG